MSHATVARPLRIVLLIFASTWTAQIATAAQPDRYARMAPLDQYLMSARGAEIALARSAAPPAISADATILVLAQGGYEMAAFGHNGFTCLVERSWMSPFDSPEFWNPRLRGAVCYNPPASRSVLPYTIYRTRLLLQGTPKAQLLEQVKAAVARRELVAPEIGAMSYMMSKNAYLSDAAAAWHSHLMFHLPKTNVASWGANLPGSPLIVDTDHTEVPEPQTIFMLPLGHWSDGTAAPLHH